MIVPPVASMGFVAPLDVEPLRVVGPLLASTATATIRALATTRVRAAVVTRASEEVRLTRPG